MLLPKKDELMVGCKRRIIDDDYYPALRKPHVKVDNTKVQRISRITSSPPTDAASRRM